MDDDTERTARAIHNGDPVMIDGMILDWDDVVHSHPDRAAIYRDAARIRLKAAEAMERLAEIRATVHIAT